MSLTTLETVQKLQQALHAKAKGAPKYRFYTLYDKVCRKDVLWMAWRRCRTNGGEAGIDGETFEDIEAYGVAKFNEECRRSAFEYIRDWGRLTDRIAFWVDLEDAYVTYAGDYIESVWWILKSFWEKDLLYKRYKVVPYCPRCGTPLSDHEVAQGYEEVTEPSVYVRLPLVDRKDTSLLVWTTTPWTLPGNVALAVGAVLGMNGVRLPFVEYGIALSVLALGSALLVAGKLPVIVAMGFVGGFAMFHGHAHGTEMPSLAEPALYAAGFSLATAALHVFGAATGYFLLRYDGGVKLLRLTGLLIAASGVYFVVQV